MSDFYSYKNYHTRENVDISVEYGGGSTPKYKQERREYDILYYSFKAYFN